MTCEKCGNQMYIDEWGGWVWVCSYCDFEGREATNQEIEDMETERAMERMLFDEKGDMPF